MQGGALLAVVEKVTCRSAQVISERRAMDRPRWKRIPMADQCGVRQRAMLAQAARELSSRSIMPRRTEARL
jgi:hypothetical protein